MALCGDAVKVYRRRVEWFSEDGRSFLTCDENTAGELLKIPWRFGQARGGHILRRGMIAWGSTYGAVGEKWRWLKRGVEPGPSP